MDKTYIAIDLKSFYASVECIERGLDPMTTNLVVADASRTEKTICLAVSPSLKAYGIPGRARLFEVIQKIKEVNALRRRRSPNQTLIGASYNDIDLKKTQALAVEYITAPPQMARYLECSTQIYEIYLKYVAPEDIHVYSIDEVLIDATGYLQVSKMSSRAFAMQIILDVLNTTGITATAGIGTNLYLAKVAMDIGAKHIEPDTNGVRIAEFTEMTYRESLWDHRPLTDFWRVGRGYAKKLEGNGLYTMGDVAYCSIHNEDLLYKLFGINAELLIDHAWSWEPCTLVDVKAYKPASKSIAMGQVLTEPYTSEKARLVIKEMAETLSYDLLDKRLSTSQLVLTVGYDVENLTDPKRKNQYKGEVKKDQYGRAIPKHGHGTENLKLPTSSESLLKAAADRLFSRIVDESLLIRRLNLSANRLVDENSQVAAMHVQQLNLFDDPVQEERKNAALIKEKKRQEAVLNIKAVRKKFYS